jgi:hypothetical protein
VPSPNEDTAKIAAQESQQLQRQAKMLTENALPANRDANQRPQWQEQQRRHDRPDRGS